MNGNGEEFWKSVPKVSQRLAERLLRGRLRVPTRRCLPTVRIERIFLTGQTHGYAYCVARLRRQLP
jgi:hypothetical protein